MFYYGRHVLLLGLSCFCTVVAVEVVPFRCERIPASFSWDQCADVDYLPGVTLTWSGQLTLPAARLQELQTMLVTCPERLLSENVSWLRTTTRTREGLPQISHVPLQQLYNFPLCLLNECHECLITRLNHLGALARDMFEREMVKHITDGYVNVGGGMAFQDLVIMTQALYKNPCAHLTVHLVDPLHTRYIQAAHEYGYSCIDMSKQVTDIFAQNEYAEDDYVRLQFTHALFAQLVSFLHQVYSRAQIHITLYRFVEDLLHACERGDAVLPQVVMSSDLGAAQEARAGFANLVRFALSHRADALALSLDKEKPTDSAMIHLWTHRMISNEY